MKGFLNSLRNLLGGKQEDDKAQESGGLSGKSFVGAICQVTDSENKYSFMGRIESYDIEYNEFEILPYRAESIPVRVYYNTPVKIQIKNGEQLTMLYGTARKQSKDCWSVALDHVEEYSEQREGFRQPLDGMGVLVRRTDGKKTTIPCKLIDISLTGICVSCQERLEIGEKLGIREVRIYPSAPNAHVFDCEVRRAFIRGKDNEIINLEEAEAQETGDEQRVEGATKAIRKKAEEKYYGCSFLYISREEREQLCKEIFFIQQQQRNSY